MRLRGIHSPFLGYLRISHIVGVLGLCGTREEEFQGTQCQAFAEALPMGLLDFRQKETENLRCVFDFGNYSNAVNRRSTMDLNLCSERSSLGSMYAALLLWGSGDNLSPR